MRKPSCLAAAAAVLASVVVAGGCGHAPARVLTITSITYWQEQAVPNFDDRHHTTTDTTKITAFTDLIKNYHVADLDYRADGVCAGGLTTWVRFTADGTTHTMMTGPTGRDCHLRPFDQKVQDLVESWR